MMKRNGIRHAVLLALLLAHAGAALADDKKGGRDKELARRMQQVQQEKSRLEQEKAELNSKLDELAAQAKASGEREQDVERKLAAARRDNAELVKKQKAAEIQIADLGKRLDDTAGRLRRTEREKSLCEKVAGEQVDVFARQARRIAVCQERNAKLVDVGQIVLGRLRKEGGENGDPLFGLDKSEAFAAYQELRQQVDAQRIEPTGFQP